MFDFQQLKQAKGTKKTHHSPFIARRVGGGYDIVLAGTNPGAAAAAAASAGKLLQGLEGPLTEQDLLVLKQILKTAEAAVLAEIEAGNPNSAHITLSKLLQAYEEVLPQHGLLPQEDTHYYRILLKLTLDPDHDWWQRFYKERKLYTRWASILNAAVLGLWPSQVLCWSSHSPDDVKQTSPQLL